MQLDGMAFRPITLVMTMAMCWVLGGCFGDEAASPDEADDARDRVWATVVEAPIADIGADATDPAQAFNRIVGIATIGSDRIAVLDGSQELRIFDYQGELVAATGGRGEGPGEFQSVYSLISHTGDSLIVWDFALRRLTVLSGNAETGRIVQVEAGPEVPPLLVVEDAFADGSLLAMAGPPVDRSFGEERWGAITLAQVSADGEGVSSIAEVPLQPCRPGQENCGRGYSAFRSTWAAGNARIYFARPDQREIEALDLSGHPVARLSPPRGMAVTHSQEEEEPSYSRLVVDSEENLWAALGAENGSWLVFASSGEYLGQVKGAGGLSLAAIGDGVIAGVRRDELGVERVVIHEVRYEKELTGARLSSNP